MLLRHNNHSISQYGSVRLKDAEDGMDEDEDWAGECWGWCGKGGMSGVGWSWSTMKLKEADVDSHDKHPPAQLRNPQNLRWNLISTTYHWTCVQGKYLVAVVVVVVVGAWILSEERSHHVDPLFISLYFKSILSYVFSYISLGYHSYCLYTLMWRRAEGRRREGEVAILM